MFWMHEDSLRREKKQTEAALRAAKDQGKT
jgi:hypothetical protein